MIVLNDICHRLLAAAFLEKSRMKGDRQAGVGVGGEVLLSSLVSPHLLSSGVTLVVSLKKTKN